MSVEQRNYPCLGWRFSYRLGMAEQATNVLLPTGGVLRDHERAELPVRDRPRAVAGDAGSLLRPSRWRVVVGSIGYLALDILAFAFAFAAFGGTPPLGPLVFGYVIGRLGVPAILGAMAFVQLRRTLRVSDEPTRLCRPLAEPEASDPTPA